MKNKNIKSIIILVLMLLLTIAAVVFEDYLTGESSIFTNIDLPNAILDKIWKFIPGLIKAFQIITISSIIIYLANLILSHSSIKKSNRMKTILGLIRSFLKWFVILVTILLVLGAFGVDTTTLLASAGILALVVGLGAQSLVADILAGFFIVFESEYQVGDIITVDGYRGTVSEIGIRVTKIVDAGGNVKIINNSDIKNIINQTSELSLAKCTMSIDYDEDVNRVEKVFSDYKEKIKKNIPAIIGEVEYKGISELAESSVNLLFVAQCKESDLYQVQRDLNKELYMMFNENNITVPFNQIVVSNREK